MGARAEIFVLSDSRDPAFFADETLAVAALRAAAPVPVWYRRRIENTGRKAGNIAEFVRRWGGRYDQMVVLDADSVVSGQVIAAMSARMAADPALALIQRIKPLLAYDEEHNTQLLYTLETYFNNCQNSVKTSKALFIHRNTLLYRLDRIAEILDLNYNDSEQMLTFQLALKAFLMCQ